MKSCLPLLCTLQLLLILSVSAEPALQAPGESVWVEDDVPAGATRVEYGDRWNWVSSPKLSGSYAHQSELFGGLHQHYFIGAANSLALTSRELLFVYVYLDAASPPSEIMLQWYDGTWEHRAYWGEDQIGWGVGDTNSRRYMGLLPPTNRWVRLEVPVEMVGLEGRTVNGMAFTLYNGRATWDRAGKQLSPQGTPLGLTILPNSPASKNDNFRIGGSGFSVVNHAPHTRVYASAGYDQLKWDQNYAIPNMARLRGFYGEQVGFNNKCGYNVNPRDWDANCSTDAIGYFWKRNSCDGSGSPCPDNDLWYGWINATLGPFASASEDIRKPVWPTTDQSETAWGARAFEATINAHKVNLVLPDPPPTGGPSTCRGNNPSDLATGASNSKVVSVKYPDGSIRWFMAFNSMIKENPTPEKAYGWIDNWRVMWATSSDGARWSIVPGILFRSIMERVGCADGFLITDLMIDNGYFYMLFTDVGRSYSYLVRSPIDFANPNNARGYTAWSVAAEPLQTSGEYSWRQLASGEQLNLRDMLNPSNPASYRAYPIATSRYGEQSGAFMVKQASIARVFKSAAAGSPSRYIMVTVDQPPTPQGRQNALPAEIELWSTTDLSKPFQYESHVTGATAGAFGYEFGFTQYRDNTAATPRVLSGGFQLWMTETLQNPHYPLVIQDVVIKRRNAQLTGL